MSTLRQRSSVSATTRPTYRPRTSGGAVDMTATQLLMHIAVACAIVAGAIYIAEHEWIKGPPERVEPENLHVGHDTSLPDHHPKLKATLIRAGLAGDPDGTRKIPVMLTRKLYKQWTALKSRFIDPQTGEDFPSWYEVHTRGHQERKVDSEAAVEMIFHPGFSKSDKAGKNSDVVALVHEKELFVWPPVKVGHTIVTSIDPPRGIEHPITIETLKTSPKVFYVRNFMSDAEAEALVAFAQDPKNPYSLRPSTTGHKSWTEGGESSVSSQRTSLNGFDVSSPTSKLITRRAFELAKVPFNDNMADGIQVLRYEPGQAYIPHTDYFELTTSPDHNWDARDGGTNRFATVFLYLSDVEEGGETVFPLAEGEAEAEAAALPAELKAAAGIKDGSWEDTMAATCRSKFAVKPRKGDALLFYSQFSDGSLDPKSLHGGCPVLQGTKWAANVWIWNGCRFGVCKNPPNKKAA